MFQFHGWVMADPYLDHYFKTGDIAGLKRLVTIADDWYRFHIRERQEARYSWFDMSAGFRAMKLALLLDRIRTNELQVSKRTERRLWQLANEHVKRLRVEPYIALNNHGLFQVLGLRMICEMMQKSDMCKGAKAFANKMMTKIVTLSYTEEGVHREHSPAYAQTVTRWLSEPAFRRWWPELIDPIIPLAVEIQPWFVFPDGSTAHIGDSGGKGSPLATDVDQPVCLKPDRCYAVKDLAASGYAIIRSQPSVPLHQQSMLFVTGMAWSLTHKHVDDLSFELFERGRFLFVDSGAYGYSRDANRNYVLSAAAHNTIGLGDRDIYPRDVAIVGSELIHLDVTEQGFDIVGTVRRAGLFDQTRTLTYDPGRSLVIHDELSATGETQYVSSLHLAPDLIPKIEPHGFSVDLGDGETMKAKVDEPDCTIDSVRGEEDPVLGWFAVGYLDMVPATVVRASCPGKNRTITWQISF